MGRSQIDHWKQIAAEHASSFVRSGMVVGLGHGSTAAFAIRHLAERLHRGDLHDVAAVPCSTAVASLARALRIPLTALEDQRAVDLTIDGADEVDPDLHLIKGGGGALLLEKRVARASRREVIVIDETKLSPQLGRRFALPVEVRTDRISEASDYIESLGAAVSLRGENGDPFVTDSGYVILDCRWNGIDDAPSLAQQLEAHPAIVDHGLFLGLATDLVIAGRRGLHHIQRGQSWTEVYAL